MRVNNLLLMSLLALTTACKKDGSTDTGQKPPVNQPPTTPPAGTSCTAVKGDAENIAIFPADNPWNKDISKADTAANNTAIIAALSAYSIKADFGSGLWEGSPIGIPYVVVCGSQTKYPITFKGDDYDDNYGDESDKGPYPIPLNAPVEGNGAEDSHVIAVDKDNKKVYELYNANVSGNGWQASSGAVFDLTSNALRTEGWTSADAAGLPIFPGLVRYEEVLKGVIDHPIRFTLGKPNVKPAYVSPARHKVNSTGGQNSLPFGARIRLKQDYNITAFPAKVQVILKAMKQYGLILADIGSNLYISGAPDERWNNDELRQLGKLKGSDFEVVKY
jgi:hypothetical protein